LVQLFYRLDALPVTQPTKSKQWGNSGVLNPARKSHSVDWSFLDTLTAEEREVLVP